MCSKWWNFVYSLPTTPTKPKITIYLGDNEVYISYKYIKLNYYHNFILRKAAQQLRHIIQPVFPLLLDTMIRGALIGVLR